MFFRYDAVQASNLVNTWIDQIWSGKISPELGLRQMTAQINALEAAGPALADAAAKSAKNFPATGPTVAPVPEGI